MPYITSKFKAHKNVTNKFNALPWFRLSKMPTLSCNRPMSLFNFLSTPLIALSVNVSWPMYWWITNDGFSLESLSCPQEIFSDAFWNIFSPLVWIVNKPESIPKRNKIFIVVKTIQDYFKLCNGWSPHVYRLKGWRNPFMLWKSMFGKLPDEPFIGCSYRSSSHKVKQRRKFILAQDSFPLFKQDITSCCCIIN